MVVYLTEQGAVLSKKAGRLVVSKAGNVIEEIPLKKIEKINILGNISLTTQVINYFLDNKIEVVFMSQFGKYRGKLHTDSYKNVILRLKQYEKSRDTSFTLSMARSIVIGKLKNYYDYLLSRSRRFLKGTLSKEIAAIRNIIGKVEKAENIDEIRGFEGIGSKYYFEGFKKLIKNPNFKFEKRIAHPPKDPINAMLSLGYSFLYNEVEAAMNAVGLGPYFGNLHTIEISKKSLLFDLVEEFRNIIVDSLVVSAINRNEFSLEDFEEKADDVVYFTKDGLKKFIEKLEERLTTKMRYHLDDEKNYIRTIFEKQARHYARVVLDEDEKYIPFFRRN